MTLIELRDLIDRHFSLQELRDICIELGKNPEHFRHATSPTMIEDMLLYFGQRHELQDDLLALLRRKRPSTTWPPTYTLPTDIIPVPCQLPPAAEHFTGRAAEVAAVLDACHPGRRVALQGAGGMGKTAVTWAALHQLQTNHTLFRRFPDGVIFCTFYGRSAAALALEQIALSYGEELRPTPQDAARRALAQRTPLLILDGAEECDDIGAVLAVSGHCGVLISSRRPEPAHITIPLAPLPPDDAAALLNAWRRQAPHTAAVDDICRLVGHLPLALRLVGFYLQASGETPAEYRDWLAQEPLAALHQGEHRADSVTRLLDRSTNQISAVAQAALNVVGLLALRPFPLEPIAAALEQDARPTRTALGELVRYGLLARDAEDGLYSVTHALVHTYARHHAPPPPVALEALADYYNQLARRENQRGPNGFAVLHGVRPHLLAVQRHCQAAANHAAAQRLTWAMRDYLDLQGLATERLTLLETGLAAARAAGNRYDQHAFLNDLGHAHRAVGQVRVAIDYYEQALALARADQDKQNEGIYLGSLGNAYYSLGEVQTAVRYHKEALAISREIGDRHSEGQDLGNLGIAYKELGEVQTAVRYYEEALTIARAIGNRRGEENHLGNLGNAYYSLGEVRTAVRYYEEALTIARAIGDRHGEALGSWNLGLIYETSDPARAVALMSVCVAYEQEIGHPAAEKDAARVAQIQARL